MQQISLSIAAITLSVLFAVPGNAEPWAGPGDTRLRHDLQLLNDSGITNIPLTAWPVAWGDIYRGLERADTGAMVGNVRAAYDRVMNRINAEMKNPFPVLGISVGGDGNPRVIRSFENTLREEAEVTADISWVGNRFALNVRAGYAENPVDGREFRPDGTYVGVALGNWMLSAGWQDRWWGPGRDSSLVLSTNARPTPGIAVSRILSTRAESKFFRWMGPWTLTSFMTVLDDDRQIENGWLWGLRTSFRPVTGLEIGLSRTAQWCGDGRKCDLGTFLRLLNGNDNSGANVDPEDEPGNQLGGIDIRWSLPHQIPVALYMQWIAEDTRRTGAQLHLWLQQAGIEHWGKIGGLLHRTHLEFANTSSHLGALGEGSAVPNVAYNHSIFRTGYRYRGRSLGHAIDGDGLSLSLGSTLVDKHGNTWNISLRHMDINREGRRDTLHTLSQLPQDRMDVLLSHARLTRFGRFHVGLSYERIEDQSAGIDTSEVSGFLRWSLP